MIRYTGTKFISPARSGLPAKSVRGKSDGGEGRLLCWEPEEVQTMDVLKNMNEALNYIERNLT